jgi:predicted amidophosphoribosyltransferase
LKKLLTKLKESTIRPIPKNGKPRFEVSERVQLYWNQRSKFKHFCCKCGEPTDHPELAYCNNCFSAVRPFAKLLGFGVITNVDKIEIWKDYHSSLGFYIYSVELNKYLKGQEILDLVKKEGFDTPNEFFDYFKKELVVPKEFYQYQWKWLNA